MTSIPLLPNDALHASRSYASRQHVDTEVTTTRPPDIEQDLRASNTHQCSRERVCRVCHCGEGAEDGPLLSPCLCAGSVEWIHSSCLNRWRLSSVRQRDEFRCELCGFNYMFEFRRASRKEAIINVFLQLLPFLFPMFAMNWLIAHAYSTNIAGIVLLVLAGFWSIVDLSFSLSGCSLNVEGLHLGLLRDYARRLLSFATRSFDHEMQVAEREYFEELARAESQEQETYVEIPDTLEEEDYLESGRTFSLVRWELMVLGSVLGVSFLYACLRRAIGKKGLILAARFVATFGAAYMVLVLVLGFTCALLCPPLCILHDESGLAVVRSLSATDRETQSV